MTKKSIPKTKQHNTKSQFWDNVLCKTEDPFTNNDLVDIAKVMDSKVTDPLLIYPINPSYEYLANNMNGIHVLFGAACNGRKSSVYWANRETEYPILEIDANIYSTQNQFIQKLVLEASTASGIENFGKQLIIEDQISFKNLGRLIKDDKRKTIIIVDNAQRLVQPKRQTILYTMLEWVKEAETKDTVVLFLVTKNTKFTDHLEKRVKSRLTANYLFYHGTSVESIVSILECRINAADVHYSLQQILIKSLRHQEIKRRIQFYHSLGKSISFFLNWFKCIICGLSPSLLQTNPNQHILNILEKSARWMSPNVGLLLLVNMAFPEIIFMTLVSLMIKNQASSLNLDSVLKEYVKVKQKHLDSRGVGSTFNYSEVVMERAFNKLIDHKLLSIDDTLETFRFAPIVLHINREEMEMELSKIGRLPMFIKHILQQ